MNLLKRCVHSSRWLKLNSFNPVSINKYSTIREVIGEPDFIDILHEASFGWDLDAEYTKKDDECSSSNGQGIVYSKIKLYQCYQKRQKKYSYIKLQQKYNATFLGLVSYQNSNLLLGVDLETNGLCLAKLDGTEQQIVSTEKQKNSYSKKRELFDKIDKIAENWYIDPEVNCMIDYVDKKCEIQSHHSPHALMKIVDHESNDILFVTMLALFAEIQKHQKEVCVGLSSTFYTRDVSHHPKFINANPCIKLRHSYTPIGFDYGVNLDALKMKKLINKKPVISVLMEISEPVDKKKKAIELNLKYQIYENPIWTRDDDISFSCADGTIGTSVGTMDDY